MSAVGFTLLLLCFNVCIGQSYNSKEIMKKVVEILDLLVKDKTSCGSGTLCPDTWIPYEGSCYLFPNGTFNFNDAACTCSQHGSHLVHIESASENTFLKTQMRKFKDANYWNGLTDPDHKGTWTWHGTRTEALFKDWSSKSPNNYGGSQYCVMMEQKYGFQWNDFACTTEYKAVCEKNMTNLN